MMEYEPVILYAYVCSTLVEPVGEGWNGAIGLTRDMFPDRSGVLWETRNTYPRRASHRLKRCKLRAEDRSRLMANGKYLVPSSALCDQASHSTDSNISSYHYACIPYICEGSRGRVLERRYQLLFILFFLIPNPLKLWAVSTREKLRNTRIWNERNQRGEMTKSHDDKSFLDL